MPHEKRSVPATIIHLRLKKSASSPPSGITSPKTSVNTLPTSPNSVSDSPAPAAAKSHFICGRTVL